MTLFHRRVYVQFRAPGSNLVSRLEGLRTSFRVEHTSAAEPSKATIQIYNLAPTSKAIASRPDAEVRLFAGYGDTARLVFVGQPVRAGIHLTTRGPDEILQIDATDGGRPFSRATLTLQYAANTPLTQVVTDVLAQTGWERGQIAALTGTFPKATAFVGRPREIVAELAARVDARWFIRDNALYVVPRGQATAEESPVLSSDSGNLVGSPVETKEGIRCRTFLDATLRPGRQIVLQSRRIQGAHIVNDAVFTGDSGFSAEFYVDLTCRPVGAP